MSYDPNEWFNYDLGPATPGHNCTWCYDTGRCHGTFCNCSKGKEELSIHNRRHAPPSDLERKEAEQRKKSDEAFAARAAEEEIRRKKNDDLNRELKLNQVKESLHTLATGFKRFEYNQDMVMSQLRRDVSAGNIDPAELNNILRKVIKIMFP